MIFYKDGSCEIADFVQTTLTDPVPVDFGPESDYLGTVKKLADEIAPGLYEKHFEQRFTQDAARARLYTHDPSGNSEWHIEWTFVPSDTYEDIKRLQMYFDSASKEGPTVLLVEAINKAGAQAIGTALNVNPCFFAAHLLPKDDSCQWTEGLTDLGVRFDSDVQTGSQVADGFRQWDPWDNTGYGSEQGFAQVKRGTSGSPYRKTLQSHAEDLRITIGDDSIGICSRFLDAQRSRNTCEARPVTTREASEIRRLT